jgi:hypothetical protein
VPIEEEEEDIHIERVASKEIFPKSNKNIGK